MELRRQLADNIVEDIKEENREKMLEFMSQNPATKLELVDEIQHDLLVYQSGFKHSINALNQQTGKRVYFENRAKIFENEVVEYREKFGTSNPEYINRRKEEYSQKHNENIAVIKDDNLFAQQGFNEYIQTYEKKYKKET